MFGWASSKGVPDRGDPGGASDAGRKASAGFLGVVGRVGGAEPSVVAGVVCADVRPPLGLLWRCGR